MNTDTLTTVRWPLEPLMEAAGHPAAGTLAARAGVTARTVWRWHHRGLTDTQADRTAVALGYHPANIWPDWYRT